MAGKSGGEAAVGIVNTEGLHATPAGQNKIAPMARSEAPALGQQVPRQKDTKRQN